MKKNDKKLPKKKKSYIKPHVESEDLTVYGAACNGTTNGSRKASTSATPACQASRLTS